MPGLGLGLGVRGMQPALLARYSLGGKAPAVIADTVAGVYGVGGRSVGFDGLFTFSRLSAAWKLNALGHWVKVLAGEPRTGHHVWRDGKLAPAGIAVCSEVRTNLASYSDDLRSWSLDNNITVTPQGTLGGSPSFALSDQTDTFGQISQNIGAIGDGEFCCQVKVAKSRTKVNAFGIRATYSAGGVTQFNGISFNAETGGGIIGMWGSTIIERKVQDCGDYWLAWFSFDATGIGLNEAKIQVFPAHNGVNGNGGPHWTGDHRCTAIQVNAGRCPKNYIKTETAPVSTASESLQINPSLLSSAFGGVMPEALTFVMKGTMSYADVGLNPQVRMLLWQADSIDRIRLQLNTVDARTGQFIAFTQKDGVANSALSAPDAYSPGVEVPFSVAAVLTATDIEGFYNGVSTGKVAHGGLPSLMAAPMEFFSPGTGTITEFCLWPEALTSSTLLEATA
ncbi:hypothetical protein MED193_01175 [Roseobacter sp. MED193]|uniref:phage head spike fiber domain-containing protein n=1 Tax=Roseobacter sp. MED193 TaxID=314262 RepID=UPI000068A20E|nr:hypothetical protein [Roseobacter sp. MED193]EAQ45323.1 hypothetical protein MED193_01175 [Roseobacter sp. MED193]